VVDIPGPNRSENLGLWASLLPLLSLPRGTGPSSQLCSDLGKTLSSSVCIPTLSCSHMYFINLCRAWGRARLDVGTEWDWTLPALGGSQAHRRGTVRGTKWRQLPGGGGTGLSSSFTL
jgi:hypothetical protein